MSANDCAPRAFARRSQPAEPDAGGLNIEGLAWDPRTRTLLFGQRGPADPGSITVIRVPVDAGVAPWAIAAPGAPSIVRARVPRSTGKQWHPRHLVRRADRRLPYSARAVGEHGRRTVSALRVERQRQSPAARCHLPSIDEAEGVVAFSTGDGRRLLIVDDRGGYAVFDYPEAAQ